MKYKLLKDLPLAKAGTEVYLERNSTITSKIHAKWVYDLWSIVDATIPEWLEEVKEPKTIYDLKKGDKYYVLDDWNEVTKYEVPSNTYFNNTCCMFNFFVTEREAKRNKLLRELATRTDKFFPKKQEKYIAIGVQWEASNSNWTWCPFEYADYHNWLVFRNVEEYNKYMTEEAKDLLFKI